jgi:hypothetical protein
LNPEFRKLAHRCCDSSHAAVLDDRGYPKSAILASRQGITVNLHRRPVHPSFPQGLPTVTQHHPRTWPEVVFIVCFASLSARAQDTQFLPELDAHLTLNSKARVYVEAKDDREGGDPLQFTFGPSIQFYLRPLVKLKDVTLFDLDDAKSRPLVFESGYRVISAPDTPVENRLVEAVTLQLPLLAGILLSDRNRADLDWQNGGFTWRYRNKLTTERTFSLASYHFIPYLAAEPFYQSTYSKWSSTDLYAGCLLPVGKHMQFNAYYEHENNTAKRFNRQNHYIGLALHLYFSLKNASRSF